MNVQLRITCFYAIVLLFATTIAYNDATNTVQCRDENNRPVDWYVLYKIPKISESSNPLIRKGLAYLYITSDTFNNTGWQLSTKEIGAQNSIPGNTLAFLYNDTEAAQMMWVLYNDDPPNRSASAKYGHTKGAVVLNQNQGFWLIHSVPKFPPMPRAGNDSRRNFNANKTEPKDIKEYSTEGIYDYPTSGKLNGQSFLCISLRGDQFNVIGKQLMYNQIIVYKRNLPESLSSQYPTFTSAANQVRIKDPPYTNKVVITSLQSMQFTSFAKSDKWQRDLYDDFVAPQLQSDMYAETWLNGRGRLPSDCNGSRVLNVESVVLSTANVDFRSSHDHSKWAVAINNKGNRNWICIGDINRADTQYNRGGGTVCFNLLKVWKNYRDSVNDVEPCPRNKRTS